MASILIPQIDLPHVPILKKVLPMASYRTWYDSSIERFLIATQDVVMVPREFI